MRLYPATSPDSLVGLDTERLRDRFLVTDPLLSGEVSLAYTHHDRLVIGGVRTAAGDAIALPNPDELRAEFFLAQRELGVINIGEPGTVTVDGTGFDLGNKECLYVGRGSREVTFAGDGAAYYLVSARAHADHPTRKATLADAEPVRLGSTAESNERTIYKYIHVDGIRSCELVLGVTVLEPGSMWNTMPCHVHDRRTEVYFYFDLAPDDRVVHLMGPPDATRNLIVAGEQAVISPPWSVHCGFGTRSYAFVWAMGGENQAYQDVEVVATRDLR